MKHWAWWNKPVIYICEVEAAEAGVQGHPKLHRKFITIATYLIARMNGCFRERQATGVDSVEMRKVLAVLNGQCKSFKCSKAG